VVEQSAVNRLAVGSSPTWGVKILIQKNASCDVPYDIIVTELSENLDKLKIG
jgi:hypothetical protein